MSLIVISTGRFTEHQTPPGHPECAERAEVMELVASQWRYDGGELVAPRTASHEQLARVHTPEYIEAIAATAGHSVALDSDTYTSPDSYDAALLAAGACVDATERVMGGPGTSSLALVRPPGHHAEADRAMGFCLFNNAAVAAAHARSLGAERVAIMDFDVHHGNGTQHIFELDPHVMYLSVHQFPFYPGTGAVDEVGFGLAAGRTVNVPLDAGATDDDYHVVFDAIITPVMREFRPDLVVVSAGFDAHERDPLASMRLTSPAFGAMTMALRLVAEECCEGRLVMVTEGGYDLRALATSLESCIEALSGPVSGPVWPSARVESCRGAIAAEAAKRVLSPFWKVQ